MGKNMMHRRISSGRATMRALAAAVALSLAAADVSLAAVFPEAEPNDSKATANPVGPMVAGDSILGNSISATTTGLDYFDVTLAPQPLGIYRHRLTITSPIVGHTGTIRGLNQVAAPADTLAGIPWDGVVGTPGTTDTTIQTSSTTTTPPRFNQWYGFGRAGRMYYRVTGAAATTADYTATLETQAVVPTPVGTYVPGQISISTFSQGHTTDTDLWVYDSNFNAITGSGNDDESPLGGTPGTGATLQSWLSRSYAPGTYYIGLSNFQMANSSPSPSDDDFRTGALMDFPDVAANSNTTVNLNMQFTITDSAGTTLAVPNTKSGPFDINWFTFTVVPEPGMLGLVALGLPVLMRRRRV
jgi:MYXO-CTERM domain-containing protein